MTLFEDTTINNLAQDELGRDAIVTLITRAVKSKIQYSHDAFVIGIFGAWGEGKTSTMRMVESCLQGINNLECLWFDPWSFSGERRLVSEFFSKLSSCLGIDPHFSRLLPSYRLACLLAETTPLPPVLASYQARLAKCLPPSEKNYLQSIKDEISRHLDDKGKHLVIFIDDLDRLDAGEVQTIFKMIRQVADFRNVIYIVGMDPDVVSLQLGHLFGENEQDRGRAFLEKIINVPIVLPAVQDALLKDIIIKEIRAVWRESNIDISEAELSSVASILLPVLNTKRAIHRFLNQLSFVVPSIGVETEFQDLCLVESLKFLNEKGWVEIYYQQNAFLRKYFGRDKDKSDALFEEAEEKVLTHYPKQWHPYVREVLEIHLFPGANTSGRLSVSINKEGCFRQYFIAGIPREIIPRQEALRFAEVLCKDQKKASNWINAKLKEYDVREVERSASLSLDIIRGVKTSDVAASLIESFSFSDLSKNYGYNTVDNQSSVDVLTCAVIIPRYMVKRDNEIDYVTVGRTLTKVFKDAPLNYCMCLFAGIYSNGLLQRAPNETRVFEIVKERILAAGRQAIFDYSYLIKHEFFKRWSAKRSEHTAFWRSLLRENDFDLGLEIKRWLEPVFDNRFHQEANFLSDILSPVKREAKESILRSIYVDNRLVREYIRFGGLFAGAIAVADKGQFLSIHGFEDKIEIYEIKPKDSFCLAVFRMNSHMLEENKRDLLEQASKMYMPDNKGRATFVARRTNTLNEYIVISDINEIDYRRREKKYGVEICEINSPEFVNILIIRTDNPNLTERQANQLLDSAVLKLMRKYDYSVYFEKFMSSPNVRIIVSDLEKGSFVPLSDWLL